MTKKYFVALATIPLLLSACSKADDSDASSDDGFEMSIDLGDDSEEGSGKINIGGEDGEKSKFSIKTEGFSMDVDLPSVSLDSDDFDLNNVSLYPGTKVTGLNVNSEDGEGGKVTLNFVAPADVETITSWFESKMAAEDFIVSKDGNVLKGKTDEGDAFLLKLTEKSGDETKGALEFSETD